MTKQLNQKESREMGKIQTTTTWASHGNLEEFLATLNQLKNSSISATITKEIKEETHEGNIRNQEL